MCCARARRDLSHSPTLDHQHRLSPDSDALLRPKCRYSDLNVSCNDARGYGAYDLGVKLRARSEQRTLSPRQLPQVPHLEYPHDVKCLFILLFSVAAAACTEPGDPWYYVEPDALSDDVIAQAEELPPIDAAVAEIFADANCEGCHSASLALGGLDISSMSGLLAGGAQAGPSIVPCDPDSSPLIQAMSGGIDEGGIVVSPMPKGGDAVSPEALQVVREWIAEGAGLETCTDDGGAEDEPPTGGDPTLTFDDDIYPLFEAYTCTTCHANGGSGGLDVSTLDALLAGGTKAGAAVVPCDPDASPLVNVMEGGWSEGSQSVSVMPPFGDPPSSEDIATLRAWIAAGAGVETCEGDDPEAE